MIGVPVDCGGVLRIYVWALEQAEIELRRQDPSHRRVDDVHRHEAATDRLQVRRVLGMRGLEHDVEAGSPGVGGGGRRIRLGHVQHRRAACGCRVGDHEAAESPLPPQHVGQEVPVLRGRRAVNGVVGGHDRARAAPAGGRLERREEALDERALADVDGIAVPPAVADVRDEVLWRRDDARALERLDEGDSHDGREVRVFAVRLLDASPADVARDVDDRREHLPDAARAGFSGGGGGHTRHERGVPRCRQADRLRERRGAGLGEAVQRLLEGDDRNAEPGLLDEVALDGVDPLGVPAGNVSGRRLRARLGAALAAGRLGDLQAEDATRVVEGRVVQVARDHVQLPELLLERHAREQVADAFARRQPRVTVRRHPGVPPGSARQRHDEEQREQGREVFRHVGPPR